MKAQCVCGETILEFDLIDHNVNACHCSICRRQTSGVIMTINIKQGSLKFIKQDHLSIYNSSSWGERSFCNVCGTNLFWRTKDQSYCNINVFSLDQTIKDLNFNMEIFIDNKPNFYSFNNSTKKLTEEDVIKLFNAQSED
ncbi:GFA family protein [Acinetobacter qingfengensis]|uniref:S-(Hydroxymethyl)glutathione synthase n=1 Tax=Acinetobacter qingfengensis TaxID=1262585 RepID=A0A1E7R327_9GAMM|nr:GFA family protein [Acinetobacter qingfengensis]KAA8733792.1 GFA family protein [Acinetobacter qingfengensis]OEY93696.1 S-(hydroxymethyl)glutathione synthase [Acinetobacter qingfengensis]